MSCITTGPAIGFGLALGLCILITAALIRTPRNTEEDDGSKTDLAG